MADGSSTFFLLLRMVLSLGIVLGLVALAVRVMRRRGLDRAPGGGRADRLVVLDRRSVTKGAHLALVRLGDEDLLLGIADRRVDLLGRSPHGPAAAAPVTASATVQAGVPVDGGEPLGGAPATALGPVPGPAKVIDVTSGGAGALAALTTSTGTRRTGSHTPAADAAGTESRMGFVEALRELTVRRS